MLRQIGNSMQVPVVGTVLTYALIFSDWARADRVDASRGRP
jgi:hypothetical protein